MPNPGCGSERSSRARVPKCQITSKACRMGTECRAKKPSQWSRRRRVRKKNSPRNLQESAPFRGEKWQKRLVFPRKWNCRHTAKNTVSGWRLGARNRELKLPILKSLHRKKRNVLTVGKVNICGKMFTRSPRWWAHGSE
jgi:hypothetical protein